MAVVIALWAGLAGAFLAAVVVKTAAREWPLRSLPRNVLAAVLWPLFVVSGVVLAVDLWRRSEP